MHMNVCNCVHRWEVSFFGVGWFGPPPCFLMLHFSEIPRALLSRFQHTAWRHAPSSSCFVQWLPVQAPCQQHMYMAIHKPAAFLSIAFQAHKQAAHRRALTWETWAPGPRPLQLSPPGCAPFPPRHA